MKKKYRVIGNHKKTGKRVYMTYATHKGQTFFNFQSEPVRYKEVPDHMFIELQIMAQTELNNVRWECDNDKLQRRANIASKSSYRALQTTNRRSSI